MSEHVDAGHTHIHRESQEKQYTKLLSIYLCQTLANFQNSFTVTLKRG